MILEGEKGTPYSVGKIIGEGGQGAVWKVVSDRHCVIKTLMKSDAEAAASMGNNSVQDYEQSRIVQDEVRYEKFARKINSLIALSVFSDIQRVALPTELLKKPYCGYVMRLMDGLESITKQMRHSDEDAISHSEKNSSLNKKLLVLRCLADILRRLHGQGLVYCDLSPNNVFVSKNPDDHEVWLIDSDNLVYVNKSKKCIGTPNYQAPEIYKQQNACSFYSDIYSFALIAFEYLTGARPFSNESIELEDCWDADDVSNDGLNVEVDAIENGDVAYGYENSQTYIGVPLSYVSNEKMRKLFYRTFCEKGRKNAQTRPTANEWYEALDEACSTVCVCPQKHAFIGNDCDWCKTLGEDNPQMKIYVLRTSVPLGEEDSDWESSPPPKYREYKHKEQYLYQSEKMQNLLIPASTFTLIDDDRTVRVQLVDNGVVFNENDCRGFKLLQVKGVNTVPCYKYPTLSVGDKYIMLAKLDGSKNKRQQTYTQIVLERLK